MMLRSCRTRLCFRLCISAVGAAVGSAVKNTAVPGTRCGGLASSLRSSQSRSASFLRVCLDEQARAAHPGHHDEADAGGQQQRHPAALEHLEDVGGEEHLLEQQQRDQDQRRLPQRPLPVAPDDEEGEQRVDDHRRRDRDAVGGGEVRRRTEGEDDEQHADEQHPVDARQIDLTGHRFRRVDDAEARQQTELDRLARQREGAGDDGLAGDDGGDGRQDHHRDQRPLRIEQIERVLQRLRIARARARPGRSS